mmetsp:Transcript_64099/g.119169  ORF Transcript_64099/g.119169 Transcript_64099/m.119169 type:complete len:482 (+) Transcript_64099:89-1534(+)
MVTHGSSFVQMNGQIEHHLLRHGISNTQLDARIADWLSPDKLNVYTASLIPVSLLTLGLAWMTRPKSDETLCPRFKSFMNEYLSVWYLAVAADWLQGPYVYALYEAYGYTGQEIAQLFVAGFGSSMVFGTFVGSLADSWGRKRSCLLYCVLYIISCITKHYNNYMVLMFGRVTGGIATSILFSGFETWMVSECTQRHGFSGNHLRYIFAMKFFGMYAIAIAAGIFAQFFVDAFPMQEVSALKDFHVGGYTTPFDMSLICLVVVMFPIALNWNENYGSTSGESMSVLSSLVEAFRAVCGNFHITLMGIVVCAFEGSMFCFVFNWTPALDSKDLPLPHGLVFSLFMMACMCGSSAFALAGGNNPPAMVMVPVLMIATVSLGAVAVAMAIAKEPLRVTFLCFMLFEFCVGCYWPVVGSLKSEVVPEKIRATVYNLYRVPLNFVVCWLLLGDFSLFKSFTLCALLLSTAVLSMLPISKKEALKAS